VRDLLAGGHVTALLGQPEASWVDAKEIPTASTATRAASSSRGDVGRAEVTDSLCNWRRVARGVGAGHTFVSMDEPAAPSEIAYYYPEPYWLADEGSGVKSLLLFFDEIAICCPSTCAGGM
jgi:hypothetical protein